MTIFGMVSDYVLKPFVFNEYTSFATSFFFFRATSPFNNQENYHHKFAEGALFAATAAGVQYCVNYGYLKSYEYSYLPTVFSSSYHNNPFGYKDANAKLATATVITGLATAAIETGKVVSLIPTLVTYTILNTALNIKSPYQTVALSISTTIIDHYLSSDNHYASFGAIGGAIASSISNKYLASNPWQSYVTPIGIALGLVAANFEKQSIDQLFTPSNFNNSYNLLTKFVDPTEFNNFIEKHFITTANIQIGMSFLGNYLLIKTQAKMNLFARLTKGDDAKFNEFLFMSSKYLVIAASYTITRTISDVSASYLNMESLNYLQNKLLNDHILSKKNFIQSSKANYSIPSYLQDIETIVEKNNAIIQWSMFGIAKLSNIGNLNCYAYLGLAGVMAGDYLFNIGLQWLTQMNQEFSQAKTFCKSQLTKVSGQNQEYAVTILQKNGLNYSIDESNKIQACIYFNHLGKSITNTFYDTIKAFYNQNILYTALHMVVGYMANLGQITSEELFLYTRTLETLTDSLLFKSKHQADFAEINNAIKRLEEFHQFLYSQNYSIKAVSYTVDNQQNALLIDNLEFARGNKEQTSKLFIKNLELIMGKIYAITGANGAGKSSFTTLLQYVLEQIDDPSFTINSGNITYPDPSINMITQKDFIPSNISLFDLVLYPNKFTFLPAQEKSSYEQKIVGYINKLKVFNYEISNNSLYEVQDSWKDLSGGQKKKLFLVKEFITCPKVIIMDEVFGPLDVKYRAFVMNEIKNSCLKDSLVLVVWHQDKNPDNTSCVIDQFFDYEAHLSNETIIVGEVGKDCLW